MFKLFITRIAPVLVLVSGLASCSKEKKSTDVYASGSPVVRRADGPHILREFENGSDLDLDLHDSIDVTDSHPTKAKVHSRCTAGVQTFDQSFDFDSPSSIRTLQILPDDVLLFDLSKADVRCSFELNLFNHAGSNHVYNLEGLALHQVSPNDLSMRHEPANSTDLKMTVAEMQDVRIRYANGGNASAEVLCQDVMLAKLPFAQVLPLAQFDFGAPQIREGHSRQQFHKNRIQNCRVILDDGSHRLAEGPLFQYVQVPKPLDVQIYVPQSTDCGALDSCRRLYFGLVQLNDFSLATWQIFNHDDSAHILKFSKHLSPVKTRDLIESTSQYGTVLDHPPMVHYLPRAEANHIIAETADDITVTMYPNEKLYVEVRLGANRPFLCYESSHLGIEIQSVGMPTIEESDENGEHLGNFQLEPFQPLIWGERPKDDFDHAANLKTDMCTIY